MTTNQEVIEIAGRLTKAQREYLKAVAEAAEPYEPRHGPTANWAHRHGITQTIVRLGQRTGRWEDFTLAERLDPGIEEILGQELSPLGLAIRAHLQAEATNEQR